MPPPLESGTEASPYGRHECASLALTRYLTASAVHLAGRSRQQISQTESHVGESAARLRSHQGLVLIRVRLSQEGQESLDIGRTTSRHGHRPVEVSCGHRLFFHHPDQPSARLESEPSTDRCVTLTSLTIAGAPVSSRRLDTSRHGRGKGFESRWVHPPRPAVTKPG